MRAENFRQRQFSHSKAAWLTPCCIFMSVCRLDEYMLGKASLIINYSSFFAIALPETKINIFQINGIQDFYLFAFHVSQLSETKHHSCL